MQKKHLSNIRELESEVEKIRQQIADRRRHQYQVLATPLFRGHANAEWHLETTLERYSKTQYSVRAYNDVLCASACAVSSLTDRQWTMSLQPDISETYFSCPPNYEFMAHVRHHGFPTPLLDWTQSLFVALYFAYQDAKEDADVAIFVYVDTFTGIKGGIGGGPLIQLLGPYVSTHKRHFLQQGQYTVAVKRIDANWFYCDHGAAFAHSAGIDQDVLYKFVLPGSLRYEVLRRLQEMNITPFSLFGNEESLMSSLAFKEITVRNRESPELPPSTAR